MNARANGSDRVAGLARLDALAAERGIPLERDVPLARYTTLRVGGPADRLTTPTDRAALIDALRLGRDARVPCFVLGNGSDLVVADAGMPGLVVRNRARQLGLAGEEISADAGTPMTLLVRRATAAGLSGLEFGISIPGTLGGAVWANAGAHDGDMAAILVRVEAWDPGTDEVTELSPDDCAFSYRDSRFKHGDEVVIGATLRLRPGDPAVIAALVAEHQAKRLATQPLADQNAGSIFRNPPGDHAGRLVDAAGLKGHRVGGAMVSPLHANFIVTERGAHAADVRRLGDLVRATVRERFDVELDYEVEFVGAWDEEPERAGEAPA
jgi:UDP-N-acetylmuramate dehydrogenase